MTLALPRRLLLLIACMLFSASASALEIALVLSKKGGAYGVFAQALVANMGTSSHRLSDGGNLEDGLDDALIARSDLIVASGLAATEAALERGHKTILATLISQNQYLALRQQYPAATLSALVLDQPPRRQLALMTELLPDSQRFALLLGPDTLAQAADFVTTAQVLGRELIVERLSTASEIVPALDRSLRRSDALLVLADPLLATSVGARSVLLSSYRYRRPVFAHSRAYVGAGALAAVFSNPGDVARDIADWLHELENTPMRSSGMRQPHYFDIAINAQVARALDITVADEASVLQRMRAETGP